MKGNNMKPKEKCVIFNTTDFYLNQHFMKYP
jgi:hypothetical protein